MLRWQGKLAVVTGASSGIGVAIVKDLVKQGVNVVGVARRENKLHDLAEELKGSKGKVWPRRADVGKEEEIKSLFKWIDDTFKAPVQIMVNNAGLSILRDTIEGEMEEWRQIFNVNFFAPGIFLRETLKSLKKYDTTDGHVININSIAGQKILDFPGFYVYGASKHALKVAMDGTRKELAQKKMPIKVTSINPGYVSTELFEKEGKESKDILKTLDSLQAEDISNGVIYALSLPQNVRVQDLTIQATGETY